MAKSKVAAENAAIEETAVVEGTTAKTYTQEELDAILAEKMCIRDRNIIFDCNSWIYFNRNIEFYSTKN